MTPDLSQAQASVQAASARAGAYLSSWGSWAAEKRKTSKWRVGVSSSVDETPPPEKPHSQAEQPVVDDAIGSAAPAMALPEVGESSRDGAIRRAR